MDIRFENKVPTIKLNNGMEMPQLGVGTFLVKEDAPERVCHAIKAGFRFLGRYICQDVIGLALGVYAGERYQQTGKIRLAVC